MTCAAFAHHHALAIAADQLSCQQIFILSLVFGRRLFRQRQTFLHPVKQFLRNDGRNSTRRNRFLKTILTNVFAVVEHPCNTVNVNQCPSGTADANGVQIIRNLLHWFAFSVHREHFQHCRCSNRIDLKVFLMVKGVAQRHNSSIEYSLQSIFFHAAIYIFRKVSGVILGVSFQ